LEDVALIVGTQQNLSNLYSLDIYGHKQDHFYLCCINQGGQGKNGTVTTAPDVVKVRKLPMHFKLILSWVKLQL
jgi:hypothetical protein